MNTQKETYNALYKESQYKDIDLPDYKITNGKILRNKKILILGVGTARDVKYLLKDTGNEVWGVDSSSTATEYSKKLGIKTIATDLDNFDTKFKPEYFDVIIAKDVIEHLGNPMSIMPKLKKFLKRSGYLVISIPNHFYFPFRIKILFGGNMIWKTIGHDHTKLFEEWNYMHKIFFTWKGFQKFLKESGFKIVKTFWDFGTLGHYSQPEVVISYLDQTLEESFRKKVLLFVTRVSWKAFSFIFPKKIRSKIVSFDPGVLSAGFYVWVKPR